MPRRPTEDSLKVRALAKVHGKTERWARKQRQNNTTAWMEFCEGQKVVSHEVHATDTGELTEGTDLEKSDRVAESAWNAWKGMNSLLNGALQDPGKQDIIPALARATREARKQWEDATKHREALLRGAGLWIPVEQVMAIRAHLKPLGTVFGNLEVTIAGRLSPENRHEFYQAFEEAMPEWNAGVRQIDNYINSLLPC